MTRPADPPLRSMAAEATGDGPTEHPMRSDHAAAPARGGRARLVRRLRYLRNWEGANVVLLPALIVLTWGEFDPLVRVPPLVLLSVILLQGSLYWHLKIRQVRDGVALPDWFAPAFRALHRLDAAAVVTLALLLLAGTARGAVGAWDLAWAAGMLIFTGAELVNYFHVQLMHDSPADWRWLRRHRRLRSAPLAEDLARFCTT